MNTETQGPGPINVIEIRKAKNGYVISAFFGHPRYSIDGVAVRGHSTYVVQSDDPDAVGHTVADILREHAITSDVMIYPARELP